MVTIRKPVMIAIVSAIVLLILIIIGIRLFQSTRPKNLGGKETTKVPVTAQPVVKGEILKTITYPGDLHAQREATVYPPVAGRIIRYYYREGDIVTKGATIAALDREEKWNKYKPVLIDAPISGRIAEVYLEAGTYVTTATSLFLVIENGPIRATLRVPDPDLRSIRSGMETLLTVPNVTGKIFTGIVTHVTPFIESETRTGEIQAEFLNNDLSLLPGMYGDVTIVLDKKEDALIIPISALLYEEETNKPYVYVITDDHAAKKFVELGITGLEKVQILSGIKEGDKVVVTGKENLSDGTPAVVVKDN